MSKQLDLVISILKESATAHKIGDTVWAKDSVKRYITHAGKIVDISPGKITIKKLSGALTTHNTEDVSKDYEHLNPNPYRKNESEEIEESFTVKDASGKVVHVALTQSAAEKKAAELQASTKEKHTAGYSREAVVKEDTIDELNKSTVDSYKEKATDELKQAKKYSKSEYGDIAKRIMARRTSGLSRVLKRNESEDIKESSMNDLASGKGDGKELKASPEYRRDRRRTAQMLAAQKEVRARVKRGYAEDDKDLDESIDEATKGHTIEAQGVRGMKNTPWRRTFKNVDHLNKWAEENDSVEIHGTRDLEQAKKGNLSPAIREDLDEAKLASPLKGHVYHTKSDAELRGIVKDAGETARVQKGMSSEGKYLDQMNDASTVLHYRSKGGKQIIATNPRMAASKQTDGSIKAKWHKNESLDEAHKLGDRVKIVGGVSKDLIGVHGHIGEIRNGPFKGAPKTYTVDYQHPKHASSHTSSIQLSKDHIRGAKSGTLEEDLDEDASDAAKFNAKIKQASEASSAGRHTHAKMHLDNARILMTAVKSSDLSKIQDSYKQYRDLRVKYPYKKPVMVESAEKLTEISLQMNIDAHAKRSSEDVVEGSIEEVSTTLLKSYAEKAREDAEKLTKQGDRAKTDTTKLSKYVKATKRHLNAHKADDKISSNEFYGKK